MSCDDSTQPSPGRWLSEDDVFPAGALDAPALRLRFPAAWPAVFESDPALKALLRSVKGARCRAVDHPSTADAATAAGVGGLHPLQSFHNAERLAAEVAGWGVVRGFCVLERCSGGFVAIRHWWTSLADGTWRDTAIYSILSDEWPAVRRGLEARLAEWGERPVLFRTPPTAPTALPGERGPGA